MGFWKFFPFLALSSVWILCLASSLQAAPFKEVLEGSLDQATLSEQEKHLLDALMQNYYKEFKARKLEQKEQNVEDSSYGNKQLAKDQIITSEMLLKRLLLASASMTAQKRGCRTATCVTQRLAGLLSRSGGMMKDNFVPTNVGSKAYGRRRRDLQD
ncbi:calcitonin protein-related peptide 2 [Sigmodon hispidus]